MKNINLQRIFSIGLGLILTAAAATTQVLAKPVAYVEPPRPFDTSPVFKTPVKPVTNGTIILPFITWAPDGVTISANDGLGMSVNSKLARALGSPIRMALKDDFEEQVQDYISGKSPFLRGTVGMIDLAAEGLKKLDPGLEPVVIVQLSWSTGADGFVAKGVSRLADLKGKTIVVQQSGPHVEFVQVLLQDAGMEPGDVTIKYVRDLTYNAARGKDIVTDPANALRNDPTLSGASGVQPDILSLTAGGKVGTGAEDSVKGAMPILTTKTANRVIADVYAVRRDYLTANPERVRAFVAAHLAEQARFKGYLDNIAKKSAGNAATTDEFKKLCRPLAGIFLADENAVNDYIIWVGVDCELPQTSGNIAFFTDAKNPVGFAATQARIRKYYKAIGMVRDTGVVATAAWDWTAFDKSATPAVPVPAKVRFADTEAVRTAAAGQDARVLLTYNFSFPAKMSDLNWKDYRSVFDTIHEKVTRYGGAVVQLRGHADIFFYNFVRMKASKGDKTYQRRIAASDKFEELPLPALEEISNSAAQLSYSRAFAIKRAYAQYLREYVGLSPAEIDLSRFDVKGMGISDPLNPNPVTPTQREANMRGALVIIGVESELPTSFGSEDLK
ncbi:MAG TPA: ABC transporter substrate-binding protein [Candidatus Methylacidiphilales bacterium]|nr:ABC transporter substrate-binding protein [Candidatus Methylacidiphilales bacterium]